MAIRKFHRNEGREDFTSKTSIKIDAHGLTKWGQELAGMPDKLLTQLPFNAITLKALFDHQKMTSNLAKKRHLMFIGKCLRKEDEKLIKDKINEIADEKLSRKTTQSVSLHPNLQRLLEDGELIIENILEDNPLLDRQKLRQLYRNFTKAKIDTTKQKQAVDKLQAYLSATSN